MCKAKFALLLTILVLAAPLLIADEFSSVSATSHVIQGTSPVPGCGGTVTGSSSASSAFTCDFQGGSYSGSAEIETGFGPYGIGVSFELTAAGGQIFDKGITISTASFEWSEEVAIEGASGNGFVSPTITGGCDRIDIGGPSTIHINLWGQNGLSGGPTGCGVINPIPVTFDVPYTLTMSGSLFCEGADYEGCTNYATYETYVSNLIFTDSQGNQLTGLTLVPVPEISAWALLATSMLLAAIMSSAKRRGHHGETRASGQHKLTGPATAFAP